MILCCGEALIDMVQRDKDGANVFRAYNGGGIYNSAIALGRLGEKTALFAGLSSDVFGQSLRAGLKASNVSLKYLRIKDLHTTLAIVKVDAKGHPEYFFIDDASAGRWLEKSDMPKLSSAVKAILFGGICLVPEPSGGTYEALMKQNHETRVMVMDPNIRPPQIKNRKAHLARLDRMIAMLDLLKISDEDVRWMTRSDDLAKAARSWLKRGVKIIAITRGGAGCSVFTPGFSFDISAPKVAVADTVGAGDTFTAGLLHHLSLSGLLTKKALAEISERDIKAAATYAMKAAAITVSRFGADPPWAHEMMDKFLPALLTGTTS